MKNLTLFLARNSYKLGFWIFLSCYCSFAIAQKTSAVQYSKTDKTFANTTEIYKSKNATDVQILTEIEKDYGFAVSVNPYSGLQTSPNSTIFHSGLMLIVGL